MRENYTLTRLYVEASLNANAQVTLPKEQAHYLGTVLRKAARDDVRVFNGRSGEWRAQISGISRKGAVLSIIEPLRAQHTAPDIWLCFAPVRKHRTAFIIEKGTELGAAVFQPVLTQRTQFGKINPERMRAQIIEASEQTERLCLPDLRTSQSLDALLQEWDAGRTIIMADEAGDCPPALEALQTIEGPAAILIGPEGGFTSEEREHLRAQSFTRPVSLGPRILRADTAAAAMLILWQAVRGDWG